MQVLRKAMPLPDLLGRICDAPCQQVCLRSSRGESIRIGDLERACVSRDHAPPRILPMPAKQKSVTLVGTGLSSLTAAWDLVRKGYTIVVIEPGPVPGVCLSEQYPRRLPSALVGSQIDLLRQLGVTLKTGIPIADPDFLDTCLMRSEAVYIGLDGVQAIDDWGLETDSRGIVRIEPKLQQTSRSAVFAGGLSAGQTLSPVRAAAEGRYAATTIDRLLQKVSLTAGREKEGPQETRLYTSLEGVADVPAIAMADPAGGYSPDEAKAEAQRCLQCECLACVRVCPYLEAFGAYPRKYAREIYNNEAIVMGARTANKLINSCSLCGLCETVCPEDFAMQDLCLQARRTMVQKGKMPPSAHEFALLDMEFSLSERFALARGAPGVDHSRYAFFPGCQLCATDPEKVSRLYDHLRSELSGGVGLILGCCGAPAHWAGQKELYSQASAEISRQWVDLGRPRLILACSTCYRLFCQHLPDIPVQSVWPVLAAGNLPPTVQEGGPESYAVHDPCTTRHEPEIHTAVRQILDRLGAVREELTLSREKTECCGFGGLMQNAAPDLAREVVQRRANLSSHDYVTYCAMCRDSLAAVGKRALHLLDLLFQDPDRPDPAGRKRTGWSQRRDNRCRLREDLLKTIWKQAPPEEKDAPMPKLLISPRVQEIIESRRILVEDLQRVIQHAETTGQRLYHPQSGHFKAAFKPRAVTFWVEYAPNGDAYEIYNAYAHRMEVSFP